MRARIHRPRRARATEAQPGPLPAPGPSDATCAPGDAAAPSARATTTSRRKSVVPDPRACGTGTTERAEAGEPSRAKRTHEPSERNHASDRTSAGRSGTSRRRTKERGPKDTDPSEAKRKPSEGSGSRGEASKPRSIGEPPTRDLGPKTEAPRRAPTGVRSIEPRVVLVCNADATLQAGGRVGLQTSEINHFFARVPGTRRRRRRPHAPRP
jgi:hypothetical protein